MKSALALHVFYPDVLVRILDTHDISSFDKIYLTTVSQHIAQTKRALLAHDIDAEIIIVDNFGYDIFPFLSLIEKFISDGIDIVCKIHTKKGTANLDSLYNNIGPVWQQMLTSSLLQNVEQCIGLFSSKPEVGMLQPGCLYKSTKALSYGNEPSVTKALHIIDPTIDPSTETGFSAGSMFWVRTSLLEALKDNSISGLSDDESAKSGSYASWWHALERVFGYLCLTSNAKVALSFLNDVEGKSTHISLVERSSDYISRYGVGMSLVSELYLTKNYKFLKENIDIADILDSPSNIMGIDPIVYYLRYGVFLGEELVPWFNSNAYWHDYPDSFNSRYNPLVHYLKFNQSKTVLPATSNIKTSIELVEESGVFDSSFYLRENPDVANLGVRPIEHFCRNGWREWRNPSSKFDLIDYVQNQFAQKDLNVNPLLHYAVWKNKFGPVSKFEKRIKNYMRRLKLVLK